jgi:hypothetical protein
MEEVAIVQPPLPSRVRRLGRLHAQIKRLPIDCLSIVQAKSPSNWS